AAGSSIYLSDVRLATTQATKAPAQARQMGALKVSMVSPGIIYEPYAPREPISFWRRCFTRSGWRRTKDDFILELKSAYAIAKLRKTGYSKQKFYKEASELYKQINTQISNGDKGSLRKAVTEKMYSELKNEVKQRESMWSKVYWELTEPIVKIRTLRARMASTFAQRILDCSSVSYAGRELPHPVSYAWFRSIGVDRNDLNKVFIQLTLEFLTKQKFEAYDSKGDVVAGDKNKEVLVREIWVFEKSHFHPGAYWRLCGRIPIKQDSDYPGLVVTVLFFLADLKPWQFYNSLAIEILVPLSFGCPSCHGLAIFGKLLGFFMQTFAEQAYKPVTLGGSPEKSADPPSHQTVHPTEDGMPREDTKQAGNAEKSAAAVNVVEKDTKELSQVQENGEEKGNATANTAAAGARAPKKMVSISDNVEEINTSKKRDKRKAGIEKLPSLESDKEEVKPLKSILKVGSNVKEKRGREVIPLDNDDLDVHQSIM
ncbi:hypothetical protein RJ639_035603, partial [Escallonia herrerae]